MAEAMTTRGAAAKVAMLGSENHLTLTLSQKKKKINKSPLEGIK